MGIGRSLLMGLGNTIVFDYEDAEEVFIMTKPDGTKVERTRRVIKMGNPKHINVFGMKEEPKQLNQW